MTATPDPHVMVLFGATGDLAERSLFPALYRLAAAGRLPTEYAVIGTGRHSPGSDDEFRDTVRTALESAIDDPHPLVLDDLVGRLSFQVSSADDGAGLADAVHRAEEGLGPQTRRLIYLSVPPSAMEDLIAMLGREGLTDAARLVVEKPFGLDLDSARSLDDALKKIVTEEQVFRIDHFTGKEAVQNLLALRFGNALFEAGWGRATIASVQVDIPERLEMEGRGSFYEATGCLRDMISTHLFQLVGLVAMEDPGALDASSLRSAKARVFADVRPLDPARVVFGQYDGYRDVDGVDADSQVETFVALEAFVDNDRWRGVPFYLRTGKALAEDRNTVTVRFRPPHSALLHDGPPSDLVIDLDDEVRVDLDVTAKRPGPDFWPTGVTFRLDVGHDVPDAVPLDAYERLLLDVLHGNQTLFTRADEVERLWEVCQPVVADPPRVTSYATGSWGPDAASELPPDGWRLGPSR